MKSCCNFIFFNF